MTVDNLSPYLDTRLGEYSRYCFGEEAKMRVPEVLKTCVCFLCVKSEDRWIMLGSEEFVDEIKHRVGEHRARRQPFERTSIEDLLNASARSSGLTRQEVCGKSKHRRTVSVREAVIVVGREHGIRNGELAEAPGIDASAVDFLI
jgi:hypothetical protein